MDSAKYELEPVNDKYEDVPVIVSGPVIDDGKAAGATQEALPEASDVNRYPFEAPVGIWIPALNTHPAPAYKPPASCRQPVLEDVEAAVFAMVKTPEVPDRDTTELVPDTVRFAVQVELDVALKPPASVWRPVDTEPVSLT